MSNLAAKATATLMAGYAMPDENRQKYPALQATEYQPKSMSTEIDLALAAESYDLLADTAQALISVEIKACEFKDGLVGLYLINPEIKWVILGLPKIFIYNKDEGRYRHSVAGEKLAGTRNVTAARLYLCAIIGDEQPLLDIHAKPQIFALTLKSSKTGLIKARTPQPGDGTIFSLNSALCDHYNIKGCVTHQVSIGLTVNPEKFISYSGETSMGVMFGIGKNAKPLSQANQKAMFDLLQDQGLKAAMANPFAIGKQEDSTALASEMKPELF